MMLQVLHCPHCHGTDIVRHGQTRQGKQRYRCRENRCAGRTFLLE
jgi:transposase-like protein